MSLPVGCFDWPALAAHRRERHGRDTEEPAAWQEALAHLDGCADCRRAALAADPTLLFRRLAAPAAAAAFDERAEVEAALVAVSALRSVRRVAGSGAPLPRRAAGLVRWAAAAALALVALSLGDRGLPGAGDPSPALSGSSPGVAAIHAVAPLPLVDGVHGRPEARIYHLDGGDDMAVVMIVDESLDV